MSPVAMQRSPPSCAVILGKSTLAEFAFWGQGRQLGLQLPGRPAAQPVRRQLQHERIELGPGHRRRSRPRRDHHRHRHGGSVISPAERMSLVGYLPTTRLISRSGIVPVTTFSDTPGVMAGPSRTSPSGPARSPVSTPPTRPRPQPAASGGGLHRPAERHLPEGKADRCRHRHRPDRRPPGALGRSCRRADEAGATVVPVEMKMTDFPFTVTTYEFRCNLDADLKDRTPARFPIKNVPQLTDFYRANPKDTQKYGAVTLSGAEEVHLVADKQAHDADLAPSPEGRPVHRRRLAVLPLARCLPVFPDLHHAVRGCHRLLPRGGHPRRVSGFRPTPLQRRPDG